MMTEKRKGELFIFSEAVLWSLFPIVTVLSLNGLSSITALLWSSFFATIFFGIIVVWRKTWKEFGNIEVWKNIFWVVISICVIYYGLYFVGLTKTTPGNASIIALFEVCTTFFLFHVFRKEHIPFRHFIGAFLMLAGAMMILWHGYRGFHAGDFLVFLATFSPPIGNYFQQKMRKFASAETILFLRTALSLPFIYILVLILGVPNTMQDVYAVLPFLAVNGIFILGASKILWIEAIHRISVPKAIGLTSFAPLITLLAAFFILQQAPTLLQFASLIPFIFGVLLLTDQLML